MALCCFDSSGKTKKLTIWKLQPKSNSFIEFSKTIFMQTQNTLNKQDIECKNNNKSNKVKEK
jgi:hypothetical protein